MKDKIYYCDICAMQNKLPVRFLEPDDLIAGYCRLCGIASVYVGYITKEEEIRLNINVPTIEELYLWVESQVNQKYT